MKALAAVLALIASFALSTPAVAQNTYSVYLDAAGHHNSGCNITLPGGTFANADVRLQAAVTPGNSPQVTAVTLSTCSGGVWTAPTNIGGGYPVDLNMGVSGSDSIELAVPTAGILTPDNSQLRLGFTAQDPTGSDVLFTVDGSAGGAAIVFGGAVVPIPALGLGALALLALLMALIARRYGRGKLYSRMLAASLAAISGSAVAAWVLFDWTGFSPIATDPAGDPTNGSPDIDIRAAFAAFKAGKLYFRIDVTDVQTAPPQITSANNTTFYVGKAGTFTVTTTGIPTPAISDGACALPSGVTFVDNGNGTATLAGTPASGTANTYNCTITANNGVAPAATQSFTLTVANAPSQTALVSGTNPSVYGQSVTFTATVTPGPGGSGTATGTVTFFDGAGSIGTGTLNGSGVATFSTGALSVASHSITAQYGGDANFGPSTSPVVTQVVNQAASTTALASSANPSVFGQSVTFTATVSITAPGAGTATGTVTFKDGASTLGTGTLSGGVATFTTSSLSVATHPISAAYGGDTNVTASTSSTVNQVVNQAQTTTALASSANPSSFNQNVTFTATVSATAPGAGTPTGTVTFKDGAATLGTGTLSAGVATFSSSTLSVATHPITAVYGGDTDFLTSTSSVVNQVVNQATQTITFTSTAPSNAVVAGPTYTVTATASSGLAVTFTIDATATSVCSISGSTVSFLAAGTCVIDANQAGNASYSAAPQVQQSFAVGKNNQTIAFTSTAPSTAVVAGATYTVSATATSGLTVAFTIDASASTVCSITGSTVSFQSVGTCVIDANQAGNANYNPAPQVQQSFAVGKGSQTITFTSTAPAAASVGGATYTVTATASSGLTVGFTIDASATAVCSISGSTVSFLSVGTCVIDADQPGDSNYNAAPQAQQSFAVGKGSQTITFTSTAPASASVGGATYTVAATAAPSGLPVAFTIDATASSVCSISGSTVSFIGVGTCVIDANQPGNANYNAAPQVQQSFAVGKGNQTITFTSTAPSNAVVAGPTYTVTATASPSGLPVTFTIDATATSVCSISGSTVSFLAAGTCVIDANQAGNANYNAAPQVQQSFVVGKNNQTISFTSTAPAGAVVAGPTYTVAATATSGLTVAFTIDATATSVCSISGSTVSFIGAGTCVIDANQAGNANYNAAPQVQQSFTVGKGNQTISFTSTAPVGAAVGGPTYTVTATATSGLAVSFTIDATATAVCSISGSTVSFIGAGTCVIDANQAGNANYNAAPQAQQSFAVAKGNQTITFTSTAPVGAKVNDTYTVSATASSGLTVTFTIDATASGVCSISGSLVTMNATGTCVIDANQAGNANFNAAPQVQQSFTVAKANQTISFTSTAPASAQVGGPTYTVTATATSGLTVTFTIDATATSVCSISGSTVTFIGGGTCVIDANQAGNANYNAAPQVQQSFTVKQPPSITSANSTTFAPGVPGTFTVTTTGFPGGASMIIGESGTLPTGVNFVDNANGTATLSGTPAALTQNASPYPLTITANNGVAPAANQSFTLNVVCPVITVSGAIVDQTYNSAMTPTTFTQSGGNGTITWSASGLAANETIASGTGVVSGTPNNTGTFTATITATDVGGCTGSTTVVYHVKPVANGDAYNALGNVLVNSASGTAFAVTDNDSFPAGATISAFDAASTAGGTVTMTTSGAGLGQFTYNPPTGKNSGTDTFTYTLSSNGQTAVGTVTFTIAGRVWFIDDTAAACSASCDGRQTNPFTNTSTFQTANTGAAGKPAANDPIYIATGGSAYSGTIVLLNGQKLIGQGATSSLATLAGVTAQAGQTLNATGGTQPNLTSGGTTITTGSGNFIHGLQLGNATVALSGTNFGTLTINNNVTIATNGEALLLNTGTLTATIESLSSSGGANNISLIGVGGTSNFSNAGPGGALSGATGTAFVIGSAVTSGAPTITYSGSIAASAGQSPIVFQNRPGGTVTLSGSVTSSGNGIQLLNNTGATTDLTGTLTLTTGTNAAFTATGGGTFTASGTGSTLSTTTGTALNVANTTIGAAGLKFRSISAGTAASGPASGIVLNNTGASGGLTVVGTGSAASGGTIQKTTSSAILLTSTKNVDLSWMTIANSAHEGIKGTGVNGFSLANSLVTNNGASDATNDNGVRLIDATGAVTFNTDTVQSSFAHNLYVSTTPSSSASIIALTVTNGAYNSSANGDGILIQLSGTSAVHTGSITGASFVSNAAMALNAVANDNTVIGDGIGAPAAGTLTISGGTMTNQGGLGVSFASGGGTGASTMYVRFVNNNMQGTHSHAINVVSGATSTGGTQKVFINGNTIGSAATPASGSAIGEGIVLTQQGKTTVTATITNNTIRGISNPSPNPSLLGGRGIDIEALGPTATGQTASTYPASITVTGNDVNPQDNSGFPLYAIYVGADNQGSPTLVNAAIHGNTVPATSACDTQCSATTGQIEMEQVVAPSTGTLFNFSGSGATVSSEICNTNTGTAGKTCSTNTGMSLTGVAPPTVN